jgi:hypothetical protein
VSARQTQDSFDPARLLSRNTTENNWVALFPARQALQKLGRLPNNWDTYGSPAPSTEAIQKAVAFLDLAQRSALMSGYAWANPHVSASDDASVIFEWWHGSHKLSIYVSADAVEFVQVWGADIDHQMNDGEIHGDNFIGLWRWLNA